MVFTKLSSVTSGDLMEMEVGVGLESHRDCVLLLNKKPNITKMTQMDSLVHGCIKCNGEYFPLMLNHVSECANMLSLVCRWG